MKNRAATESDATPTLSTEGTVVLFGHDPTIAELEVVPRPRSWRVRKALLPLAAGLAVAPVVALIPPHAPWALIAIVTGGYRARLRWRERYTIRGFDGSCPRCGESLVVPPGTRLRTPHPLSCASCGHEPILQVDPMFA